MLRKTIIMIALIALAIFSINEKALAVDSVYVWFGNVDGSPLAADTGQLVGIYVYLMTTTNAYLADCHICLGAENRCFDSLLSQTLGEIYYPFNQWDLSYFMAPHGTPPNPAGWSSQSFIGFARLVPPYDSPWGYFDEPTRVLKMVFKAARDLSLVGELAECLRTGLNLQQGPSNFGDTLGFPYSYVQYFSPVQFAGGGFVAGTVTNVDGEPLEGTIIRDMQTLRTTFTDENGEYSLGGIYQGSHNIWFDPPSYAETTITAINVVNGQTTPLDLEVSVMVGIQQSDALPDKYELKQNYPNPFNPTTTIEYLLPQQSQVAVSIYDIQGRLVSSLVDKIQPAGRYQVSWDAGEMPSGMYFYHFDTGDFSATKKMILLK